MASPTVDFKKHIDALKKSIMEMAKNSQLSATQMVKLGKAFDDAAKESKELSNTLQTSFKISKKSADQVIKLKSAYEKKLLILKKTQRQQLDLIKRDKEWAAQQKITKQAQEIDILNWKKKKKAIGDAQVAAIKQNKEIDKLNAKLKLGKKNWKEFGFSIKSADGAGKAWVRNQRNIGGSLSVIRSKLLIVAFGANMLQRSIGNLVKSYGQQQAAELKVQGTLMTTGMAANITFGEIKKLTKELQANGVVGDEVNLQMATMMLTYDKIGKDVFPRALKAANDMATTLAMGIPTTEDLESKITMLSKALQDPVRGMTALRKVGFSLSVQDEQRVKTLMKLGKVQKAQNVILKASNKQYGNMAKIIASSTLGQLNAMTMALGDMREEMGAALAPAILELAGFFKSLAGSADPSTIRGFTKATIALGVAFLVVRTNGLMHAKALALITAAEKGATVARWQHVAATKALNLAIMANPLLLFAGTIAVALPIIIGLADGFRNVKDEAKDAADETLKLTEIFAGMNLDETNAKVREYNDRVGAQLHHIQNTSIALINHTKAFEDASGRQKIHGEEVVKTRNALLDLIPAEARAVIEAKRMAHGYMGLKEEVEKYILAEQDRLMQDNRAIGVGKNKVDLLEQEKKASLTEDYTKASKAIKDRTDVLDRQLGMLEKVGIFESQAAVNAKIKAEQEKAKIVAMELSAKETENLLKNLDIQTSKEKELTSEMNKRKEIQDKMREAVTQGFEFMNELADIEIAKQNEIMENDINNIKQTSSYKLAQKRGDNERMAKLEKEAMKKTFPERLKLAKQKQQLSIANISMDLAVASMRAFRDFSFFPALGIVGMLGVTKGLQIAEVLAQPLPKFARGGLIGGRRHSRGGTMIEAEQGEFIMNRGAVNSVGLENLNRINAGGGGTSNVTVNVSGNVMSQEYVENELSEQIREAIRRGESFGES